MVLWLTTIDVYHTTVGETEGMTHNSTEEKLFQAIDILFRGVVVSAPSKNIVDSYMHLLNRKEMWDVRQNLVSLMQTLSCILWSSSMTTKMIDNHYMVEQAHQIQHLLKEFQSFPCVLPHKFMAICIIILISCNLLERICYFSKAYEEFSVANLIGSFDVEEKARIKQSCTNDLEGSSSANLVRKNRFCPQKKAKCKDKKVNANQITGFKKKKANKKE